MTRAWVILIGGAVVLGAATSSATTVTGVVRLHGQPASGVIVYLEAQGEPPPREPVHVIMDQKDLAFVPGTLPIARGTIVDFRNSDDVEHNVFSPSDTAHKFDLGAYRRGESRSVVFDRVGEALVLCNIHMEMAAKILVLRDPYFTRGRADGGFRIEAVPAGTYTLRLWRDGWLPLQQSIDVPHEDVTTVNVDAP